MVRPGTQSTFLKFFRCSRFSEFDSNVLSNFLILSDTVIFNISSKFIARFNTNSYTFRDSVNKLIIPQPHTNYLRNIFS